jgi:hypothetical protein
MITSLIEFLKNISTLISASYDLLTNTAHRIDSVNFNETVFHEYLGYAAYVMGQPLYGLFITTVLIAIGLSLWAFLKN